MVTTVVAILSNCDGVVSEHSCRLLVELDQYAALFSVFAGFKAHLGTNVELYHGIERFCRIEVLQAGDEAVIQPQRRIAGQVVDISAHGMNPITVDFGQTAFSTPVVSDLELYQPIG